MSIWKELRRATINGVDLVVKERMDSRNHHGATEYLITAYKNGNSFYSERHPWNVWLGHCHGQLLLPEIVKRANASETRGARS